MHGGTTSIHGDQRTPRLFVDDHRFSFSEVQGDISLRLYEGADMATGEGSTVGAPGFPHALKHASLVAALARHEGATLVD